MRVQRGLEVELAVLVRNEAGEEVESGDDGSRLIYVHGMGELPERLESALDGAEPGAKLSVTLEAGEAYGDHNPDGIVTVPRADLPADAEVVPGDWITIAVEESDDPDLVGEELEMRVLEISPDGIVLDANHPLAGREVTFDVEVLDVREPGGPGSN